VVHRDLKPDNIMLVPARRRGEKLKVLDFGISSKSDELTNLTTTGSLLGTPHYMSPEQAKGRTDVDRRADLYAIGVLLYECAVGEVPFDAENYNALIQEILNTEPVPPRARGASISEAFEAVLLSAMSKVRDRRPATADLFRERLLEVAVAPSAGAPPSGAFAVGMAAATPAQDARLGARARMPTLDAGVVSLEHAGLDTTPAREAPRAPPLASNVSPLEQLPSTPPPGPPNRLEIDSIAMRRPPRRSLAGKPAKLAERQSLDDSLLSRRPVRIAIAAFVAIVALIVVVRFVVRPLVQMADAHASQTTP
jgi:serine/threonine protein kinase